MKKLFFSLLCLSFLSSLFCTASLSFAESSLGSNANLSAAQIKEIEKIQKELHALVDNFLLRSSENIIPSKANPKIEELTNGKIRVTYIDFDRESIVLNVYPSSNKNAKYFAKIHYKELHYKSEKPRGTRFSEDAFTIESARNVLEIASYRNGKWDYSK